MDCCNLLNVTVPVKLVPQSTILVIQEYLAAKYVATLPEDEVYIYTTAEYSSR